MKKNNFGFTLVELLIIISIISISTVVGLTSFGKSFNRSNFNSKINFINNEFEQIDSKIGKKTTDYNIYLISGEKYYYYYENNLYKNKTQFLDINGYTGTIYTNDYTKNSFVINIYKNSKLQKTLLKSSTGSYDFNFGDFNNYKIMSLLDDEILNTINLKYYSQYDGDENFFVSKIYDEDNNAYSGVIIKNFIGGKKSFTDLNGVIINKDIKVDFENNTDFTTLDLN